MYQQVLKFWFEEIDSSKWWQKDNDFDQLISDKFQATLEAASKCELFAWRHAAEGRLAEIIVLDQFSRNIYRDSAMAFSNDQLALALAQEAISLGADIEVKAEQRGFFYLPFMHSESPTIHETAVTLYQALGNQANLDFELKHKSIIDRFGRYPHRNDILGRKSTAEELTFLKQPGSGF